MRFGLSSIRCWTSDWVMKAIHLVAVSIAGLSAVGALAANRQMTSTASGDAPKLESIVDAAGNLHVPSSYRTIYQFLGSWAVAAGQGRGSKELHIVYASPGTVAAYGKDGRFADGAVLVKEVFETGTAEMTTGTVSHAETLKGWFVMVKDGDGRYSGNKLWGD